MADTQRSRLQRSLARFFSSVWRLLLRLEDFLESVPRWLFDGARCWLARIAPTRKTLIAVGVAIVALGAYSVMTWGLVVLNIRDFDGQRDIRLVDGLKSDVWLAPKSSGFGVPFVFAYHHTGKPFALRLQIWDDTKKYQAIEISEAIVEYEDGSVIRKGEVWSRTLKPYTQHLRTQSGDTQTQMFMLSDEIEGLVQRHSNLTITLNGHLITVNGEVVRFEASESFQAESSFEVTTGWDVFGRL